MRVRYQRGYLRLGQRKKGPDRWEFLWWDSEPTGGARSAQSCHWYRPAVSKFGQVAGWRCILISNLLGFLQSLEREPFMAIIHAYFDESGKMGDHPVVTFTGVCANQSRLKTFDDAWNTLLRQYGLKSLHMYKASQLNKIVGPRMPRHQPLDERIKALTPFADCINEHLECGLIQALDVKGFKSLTVAAKAGVGSPDDPHYLAFARGILEIVNYASDDDKVSLICDDDENTAWGCYAHYRAIRKAHEGVKEKIVSLSFSNDEYFPSLQAADMVAYLSRKEAKRQFYGDKYLFQPLFQILITQQPPGHMQWFKMFADESALKSLGTALGKLKIKKPRK